MKESNIPPATLLAGSFLTEADVNSGLTLVTGPHEAGKSTWCRKRAEIEKESGCQVNGLLSPGVYSRGRKIGIDLVNLESGEHRRLAMLRDISSLGLTTNDWGFDRETLVWGNYVLNGIGSCDVFILDELGPLEFKHNQGLLEGFRVIEKGCYERAYVVVRPGLVLTATARWPVAGVVSIGA